MKNEQIEKGLLEIPLEMHKIEKELLQKNQEKRELEADIAKRELWMRNEINNETIEDNGKEKKKYSNAEQREYAFHEKSRNNTSYLDIKMRLQEKDNEIELLKINFNYQKGMHRSLLAIAKLTAGSDE